MANVDDVKLYGVLHREMIRVDELRMKLDMRNPNNLFSEFMMRRALLHARLAIQQHNVEKARHTYAMLACFVGVGYGH